MKMHKRTNIQLFLLSALITCAMVPASLGAAQADDTSFTLEPEFSMDSGDYGGGDTITTYAFSVTGEYQITPAWTLSLTIVPYLHQDETYTDVVLVAGKPVHHFDTSGANPHHGNTHVHAGQASNHDGHNSGHPDSHGTSHNNDHDSAVHQQSDHHVQSGGSRKVAVMTGVVRASIGGPVEREIRRHGSASGIGDTTIDLTYRLVEETDSMPETFLHTGIKIPMADDDKGLGTGKVDYQLGVSLGKEVGRWSLEGGVDYNILGKPDDYDLDNYVSGYGEVATEVLPSTEIAMQLSGAQAASEESKGELALGLKLRYDMEQAGEFSAGLQKGLADGSPDYSVVLGYSISF